MTASTPSFKTQEIQVSRITGVYWFMAVATDGGVYASIASIQIQALQGFVADWKPTVLHCSGLNWCGLDTMPHGRTLLVGNCSHQH